jgi:hypothetical protein
VRGAPSVTRVAGYFYHKAVRRGEIPLYLNVNSLDLLAQFPQIAYSRDYVGIILGYAIETTAFVKTAVCLFGTAEPNEPRVKQTFHPKCGSVPNRAFNRWVCAVPIRQLPPRPSESRYCKPQRQPRFDTLALVLSERLLDSASACRCRHCCERLCLKRHPSIYG